jgi:hypothetical protein
MDGWTRGRTPVRLTGGATAALALCACLALAAAACGPDTEKTGMPHTQIAPLTRTEWDALARRTVFFGHQSVGENVLDGLRKIGEIENWPALRIVDASAPDTGAIQGPALVHEKIGQNGDPHSKVQAFREALDSGLGARVDVALMKFCFWDIRRDTNIDTVFTEYQQTMADLVRRYPKVTFAYATVPLVAADVDWRARLRRLVGLTTPSDDDNVVRERLNRKIREAYGSGQVLFDVARAEEEPSGAEPQPELAADFSSDGAHLNEAGRRRVGTQFVRALSAAPSQMAVKQ